jgi:hypothetical protein
VEITITVNKGIRPCVCQVCVQLSGTRMRKAIRVESGIRRSAILYQVWYGTDRATRSRKV